ncbi:hypothetical protein BH23BAC1_BH23BAC1_50990 [soil metagenome]
MRQGLHYPDNFLGRDIFDMIGNNGHNGSLPDVNVLEAKDAFKLEVAIPGFKKEQFNMNLEKKLLPFQRKFLMKLKIMKKNIPEENLAMDL